MKRVFLVIAVVMVMGCVSTPQGVKMAPPTEKVADTTAAVLETALPLVAPVATAIPYGPLIIALLTGALATYLKARPHLVANKEILAGMKAGRAVGVDADIEMAKATGNSTKAIMVKAGV